MTFRSTDKEKFPVYHTNVMMAIGSDVAVVCLESVEDEKERQHLRSRLREHHEVHHFELFTLNVFGLFTSNMSRLFTLNTLWPFNISGLSP